MEIYTQERLDQIQTEMLADPQWRNVAGCKACGGYVEIGDWYEAGDHYGTCCLPMLRSVRAGAKKVPAANPAEVKELRKSRETAVPELLFRVRLTNGHALMVHAKSNDLAEAAAEQWMTEHGYADVAIHQTWMGQPDEVTEHGMLIRA